MFTPAMWIRPSPHTRHTSADAASCCTAEPGTAAENPPTMGSSCVTRPPRLVTRDSAELDDGAASRTITEKVRDGSAAACAASPGSVFATAVAGEPDAGG